jgi:hypothetical protein
VFRGQCFIFGTSEIAADFFDVVVSWSSDDLDSSLAKLIERRISDIEWDWIAGRTVISKGMTDSVTPI